MRRLGAVVVLGAALLATGGALAFVAVRGSPPARSMDERVRSVASALRCPVCQDLSVADSPSVAAREIRSTIARRLRDGRSPQEIRDYFVGRFGPSILLTPQGSGVGLAAWLTPGLLFAAGLTLLIGALWRWSRRTPGSLPEETVTHQDRALLDRELEREDIG